MDNKTEIILARYLAKESDAEEIRFIEEWKDSSPENIKEFDRLKKLWDKAGNIPSAYTDSRVEEALRQTKRRMPQFRSRRFITFIRQAAAVLILSVVLASAYQFLKTPAVSEHGVIMKEVTALNGMKTSFTLPDGSVVDLFPGSKLKFPDVFEGVKRKVELEGQGYFRVTHNSERPFVVEVEEIDIKVLGTEFNVRAYGDEDIIETVLVKGKVMIEKDENGKHIPLKTLNPNQRTVFNRKTKKIELFNEPDVERYVNWTKGILAFDGDPLDEVVKELELWYNVDIVVKDQNLRKFRFTGTFNGESIEEVLSLLKFSSDFKYKITEGEIRNGKYSKRKIILFN